jgi:hypothetical protein
MVAYKLFRVQVLAFRLRCRFNSVVARGTPPELKVLLHNLIRSTSSSEISSRVLS